MGSPKIQGALVVTEDVSKFLLFEGHLFGHFLQGIARLAELRDGLLVIFTSNAAVVRVLPGGCDGFCVEPGSS